jgi:hypothetical protein
VRPKDFDPHAHRERSPYIKDSMTDLELRSPRSQGEKSLIYLINMVGRIGRKLFGRVLRNKGFADHLGHVSSNVIEYHTVINIDV